MEHRRAGFSGFSTAGLKFLRDLKKHNDRNWFNARKHVYEAELLEPLQQLLDDATDAMRKARVPLASDPGRRTFRIYRDIRFSRDKSPYKTNLGAYFGPNGEHDRPGGLYLHIVPGESFMTLAFYELDPATLFRWRSSIAKDPKRFQSMLRALERNGLKISEEHATIKRMPRGFEALADSPMAKYFRLGSFNVSQNLSDADISSRRLIARMVAFAKTAKPLMEYGRALS
jgi:uncharacterized protein (TIGR02453 family)